MTTPHPMSEDHFIVSHSVVLDGGKYLGRAVFTPKSQPVSTHELPAGYKGKVTVTSTCNLHDFWVAAITV
ncbi:MAG: desulfoferrodoxin family protein [Caulobacteraceae bacterium]